MNVLKIRRAAQQTIYQTETASRKFSALTVVDDHSCLTKGLNLVAADLDAQRSDCKLR